MGTKTTIEWTDATWNPIRGCSRVSEGCRNCYAERMAARFAKPGEPYEGLIENGHWSGKVKLVEDHLNDPLRWRKPRRVFVNSMSDLFHESMRDDEIWRVFDVMSHAGWKNGHTFQVLTKRPERMRDFMLGVGAEFARPGRTGMKIPWPPPCVWLGVSVENQKAADDRIFLLLQTPAALRFVSCEPLLGSVDLTRIKIETKGSGGSVFMNAMKGECASVGGTWETKKLDWLIAGGESGPSARPMHPDWARSLRDQCQDAGVPFFFKQMAKKGPIPADLLVREFPDAR